MIQFFVAIFFLSTLVFAEGFELAFSKAKLAELKKDYQLSLKHEQPVKTFEKVFLAYKIPFSNCKSSELKKAISDCKYMSCFKGSSLGGTKLLTQYVVSSKEFRPGVCIIANFDRKFFVPIENLPKFSELYIDSQFNQDNEDEDLRILNEVSEIGRAVRRRTVIVSSKKCVVDLTYKFNANPFGLISIKVVPPPLDGYRIQKVGKTEMFVLTLSGVSYVQPIKKIPLKIYAQVSDYTLTDESKTLCKNENSTLLFELEKNGNVEKLFPIN